ncbi:MAG: NYN domain-containing protein, partial [Hyphomicrobiaceae bacterium]
MQRESSETILSAVFVDYDNVYLSLKRKSEEAAKRFAKDASSWIRQIASGALITPTNSAASEVPRRLVMNRCYGNPVPRRNASDNSTDMNSFAFVRHHFLRSGFEIIDCPPLTAQLKNSSDIRMVMDIRDYLDHKTDFDEFIILSSDADFTPVLHRLRSYAKRTVIFANDNTVAPYTALSDGEVRETDLIAYLLEQRTSGELTAPNTETQSARDQIIEQVVQAVLEAESPLPLEALAERAIRALGHDKTVGGNWAGAGSFRELLVADLPEKIKLTGEPPYLAYEAGRQLTSQRAPQSTPAIERQPEPTPMNALPTGEMPAASAPLAGGSTATALGLDIRAEPMPLAAQPAPAPTPTVAPAPQSSPLTARSPAAAPPEAPPAEPGFASGELQQSISRIHEACQAPPFSPPEYRALFGVLAQEISENQLQGIKTLENVIQRASELGIAIRHDDARYLLDAVSDADPWFEQGATSALFASRFRNFVVTKCQERGLNLTAGELDLIDAWFAGSPKSAGPA